MPAHHLTKQDELPEGDDGALALETLSVADKDVLALTRRGIQFDSGTNDALAVLLDASGRKRWDFDAVANAVETLQDGMEAYGVKKLPDDVLRWLLAVVQPVRRRMRKGLRSWGMLFVTAGASVVTAIVGISVPVAWGFAPIGVLLAVIAARSLQAASGVHATADAICSRCSDAIRSES